MGTQLLTESPLPIVVAVPGAADEPRALAFRCAVRAAGAVGAVAVASTVPRAGLFSVLTTGRAPLSVTHAATLAAAVASPDGLVGIDAEPWSRNARAVRRILFPGEGDALFAAASALGFPAELAVWCAKEAVGKALGSGLTHADRWRLVPGSDGALWHLDGTPAVDVALRRHNDSLLAVAFTRKKVPQKLEITIL